MIATVFIWLGIIIGGSLLILLLFPFQIKLQAWADVPDQAAFNIVTTWGWGLIGIKKQAGRPLCLRLLGFPAWKISFSGGKKKNKTKSKPNKKSPIAKAAVVRNHFDTMMTVMGRLVKATFPTGYITARVGLSDPADTAVIAFLSHYIKPSWKYFQIDLTPSYEEEVVRIATEVQATVVIGYIVLTSLLLLLKKQTRMMLYSLRHS